MQKNVASQKIQFFSFIPSTGLPKTGDAANMTAYVSKDYGAVTVLGDTSATEIDSTNAKGWYSFDLTQGETNADVLLFTCKSSTSDVSVVGEKCYTIISTVTTLTNVPAGSPTAADIADAVLDEATSGHTTAGTVGKALSDTLAAVDTEVAAIKTKTDFLPSVAAGAAGGLFIAGSNAATSITTALTANITGNVTGNLSGSVGSVTGLTAATVHTDLDDIQARLPAALTADGNIKADTLRVGGTAQTAGDIPALVTTVDTVVDAIKVKTDKLTYTSGNDLDVNIQKINDTAVTGDGDATPWGPA